MMLCIRTSCYDGAITGGAQTNPRERLTGADAHTLIRSLKRRAQLDKKYIYANGMIYAADILSIHVQ